MGRLFREDFDRDRSFVVLRAFTFSGQGYLPDQSVDKAQFSVRRLRQMYDMRQIGYPPGSVKEAPKSRQPVPEAVKSVEPSQVAATPRRRSTAPPKKPPVERRRVGAH